MNESSNAAKKPISHWLVCLLLLLTGFSIYVNSLPNEMFWDDDDFILKNRYIKDWRYWPKYFTDNVVAGNYFNSNYWRPALLGLFAAEWRLWKDWAPGYHAVSIFFHSADSVLLYILLWLIFKDFWIALCTALFFLVHPIHTEAVVYANAISDPLAAFFILLCLIFYTQFRRASKSSLKILFYCLSFLMYPVALMVRETAFVLPGYLIALDFLVLLKDDAPKARLKKMCLPLLPFAACGLGYLYLRATALNFNNTFNFYKEDNVLTEHPSYRFFTFLRVLCIYAGLIFFPWDLHVERSVVLATSLFSLDVFFGFLLVGLMVYLLFKYWRSKPVISFSVLWFWIGIFLSSNLFILINALLYEHFLYLPMIGVFLITYSFAIKLIKSKNILLPATVCFIVYLFFLCSVTVNRNRDWRDSITFYENLLKYAPKSYRVINNLGIEYADKGFFPQAEHYYRIAIELDPVNPIGYHNMAGTYRSTGRIPMAIETFKKAISLDPQFVFSYKSLAQIYLDQRDYPNTKKILESLYLQANDKLEALLLLTRLGLEFNQFEDALKYLKLARDLPSAKSRAFELEQMEALIKERTGKNPTEQ